MSAGAVPVEGEYQSRRRQLAVAIGLGVAAFVAQLVAVALWIPPIGVSPIWLVGGILLGAALLTETRRWPALLLAGCGSTAFALWILGRVSTSAALIIALAAGLQTLIVAIGLRIALRRKTPFDSLREFFVYLVIAVAGGGLLGPTLFLAVSLVTGVRPVTFAIWRIYGLSVVLGYLIATPVVMMLSRPRAHTTRLRSPSFWAEGLFLGLVLTWSCAFVFTAGVSLQVTWSVLAIMVPILLLWASVRFGVFAVSLALLAITVISTLCTVRGLGPIHRALIGVKHAVAPALRPRWRTSLPHAGDRAGGASRGRCRARISPRAVEPPQSGPHHGAGSRGRSHRAGASR